MVTRGIRRPRPARRTMQEKTGIQQLGSRAHLAGDHSTQIDRSNRRTEFCLGNPGFRSLKNRVEPQARKVLRPRGKIDGLASRFCGSIEEMSLYVRRGWTQLKPVVTGFEPQ